MHPNYEYISKISEQVSQLQSSSETENDILVKIKAIAGDILAVMKDRPDPRDQYRLLVLANGNLGEVVPQEFLANSSTISTGWRSVSGMLIYAYAAILDTMTGDSSYSFGAANNVSPAFQIKETARSLLMLTEQVDPTDASLSPTLWVLRSTGGLLFWADPKGATPQDASRRHSAIADCINEIYKFGPERTRAFGQVGPQVSAKLISLAEFVKSRRESPGCFSMILLVVGCGIGAAVACDQMLI